MAYSPLPPLGQTTATSSLPVVFASDKGLNIASVVTLAIGSMPAIAVAATNTTIFQGGAPWVVNASVIGVPSVTATYAAPWNVTATVGNTVNTLTLPQTTGGLSIFQGNLSATTATLKAGAGQLYGYHIFNNNATQVYVNMYNATTATVGLTAPTIQLGVPASGGATFDTDIGASFSLNMYISATVSVGGVGTPTIPISTNVYYK